jgi:hypothetical protein
MRNMNVWIGTSGFQYAEWKGNFYPEDLPTAKMLPFYAERFSTTESKHRRSFGSPLKRRRKSRIGRSCAIVPTRLSIL